MKQNRNNVFNLIHKGLRGLLYDTAMRIQREDFSTNTATETIEQVNLVLNLFDEHAHHEDKYLLPLVQKHNAALVQGFEKDHVVDHELSEKLRALTKSWTEAKTADEKLETGRNIFMAFNEFIAFNLYHMNNEEGILLFTLWKHYTDEELHEAEVAIVTSIPIDILMIESTWMMRSLNDAEITGWLTGVKLHAPEEVFAAYKKLATNELSAERWLAISAAIENVASAVTV
ncbi:MAG: hemerythrin domain-containing protein [Chitinophagaceae bacterium]|nr:hemerythrin domain-containing protein [Chitinophagaceae bacterium]